MLGINYKDEKTKLRYQVVEVKRIKGVFESPEGSGVITIDEKVVIMECQNCISKARGFIRFKSGQKIPVCAMEWLSTVEYSYPFFKQLIWRGTLKQISD